MDFDVLVLDLSLEQWVNDGLMAIFFFVAGMEIKRELLKRRAFRATEGRCCRWRAALGGNDRAGANLPGLQCRT